MLRRISFDFQWFYFCFPNEFVYCFRFYLNLCIHRIVQSGEGDSVSRHIYAIFIHVWMQFLHTKIKCFDVYTVIVCTSIMCTWRVCLCLHISQWLDEFKTKEKIARKFSVGTIFRKNPKTFKYETFWLKIQNWPLLIYFISISKKKHQLFWLYQFVYFFPSKEKVIFKLWVIR